MLVDTNAISELMRPNPSPAVRRWFGMQPFATLHLTAPVLAELLVGIARLPGGQRRTALEGGLGATLRAFFGGPALPFNGTAAIAYADLVGDAEARGECIGIVDGQIAAIAKVHGLTVATRDTAPFLAMGIPVINPWHAAG